MNVITEYAPLLAAAAPVLMIAVINVCLALQGERDTLLFPALRRYSTATTPAELNRLPSTETVRAACVEPANDEIVPEAA